MSVVYVLFEYDPSVTGPKKEHPIGVVTSEEVAEDYYQKDPKNRDWIPFNLDEVPEQTGVPGSLIPEKEKPESSVEVPATPSVDYGRLRSELEQTQQRVDRTNLKTQQMLEKLQRRKAK